MKVFTLLCVLLPSVLTFPLRNDEEVTTPAPPPYWEKAKMARYVLHVSDWGSIATISTQKKILGLPYANVASISDGIIGKSSSGIPYFFKSGWDVSSKDMAQNPAATLLVTLAQSDICKKAGEDPMSPVCARVMLTGNFVKVTDPKEIAEAKSYMFTRHPAMEDWPTSHGWFFAKLDLKHIQMLDYYGGITTLDVEEFYNTTLY